MWEFPEPLSSRECWTRNTLDSDFCLRRAADSFRDKAEIRTAEFNCTKRTLARGYLSFCWTP